MKGTILCGSRNERQTDRFPLVDLHHPGYSPRPDFIDEALPGIFLWLPCGIPCPRARDARRVRLADFPHSPSVPARRRRRATAYRGPRMSRGPLYQIWFAALRRADQYPLDALKSYTGFSAGYSFE